MTELSVGFDADQNCAHVARTAYGKGARFCMRYLKNLTNAEVMALHAAGLAVGLIFESTAQRALAGINAGHLDGATARRQAQRLGAPAGVKIAWTADFDEQSPQDARVLGYGSAFKTECIAAGYGAEVYGNGALDQAALAHHLVEEAWLAGGSGMRGTKVFAASGKAGLVQGVGDKWPSVIKRPEGMPESLGLGISIDFDVALVPLDQLGLWLPPTVV